MLSDLRDLTTAVSRCRQLLDLDADPVAVWDALRGDVHLGPVVEQDPGRRVPGAADGFELAARAVIGQQVSVSGARTVAGRLVQAAGDPLPQADGTITHLFPTPAALVELARRDPGAFAMPAGRRRALVRTGRGRAPRRRRDRPRRRPDGTAPLTGRAPGHRAVDRRVRSHARAARPGRVHAHRPRHPPGGARRRPARGPGRPRCRWTSGWRPWRSYAMAHLWSLPAPATQIPTTPLKGRAA